MLRAIRDNEQVAESLGKKVTTVRMKTIIIASAIGAVAGAIDAFKAGGAHSRAYQRVSWTFWPWVIVTMGGPANNMGVILGTFVFTLIGRVIDFYKYQLEQFIPFSVVWLHSLLIGIILILILMYKPEGILREKPTKTLKVDRFIKRKKTVTEPLDQNRNFIERTISLIKNTAEKIVNTVKKITSR